MRKPGESDSPIFVELFFDLAYVFVFMRLAEILAAAGTMATTGQVVVMLLAVWWVWMITAILTDVFDPRLPVIQNLVIATTAGAVVMATAMPEAFHQRALTFVLAYLFIHLAREMVLIPSIRMNRAIQARSLRLAFWHAVSAVPWLAGALAPGLARLVLWSLAIAIEYVTAWSGWPTPRLGRTSPASRMFIAAQLAERHRQIVIVAFGELILTCSTGLDAGGYRLPQVAAFALSLGSVVLLFQLYLEQVRSLQQPEAATRVARIWPGGFVAYWHLLIVAGVVCISAGARIVATHPGAPVPLLRVLIILAGPALCLFGTCLLDWSLTGRLSWARVLSAPVSLALVPAVSAGPAWAVMVVVDGVLLFTLVAEELLKRRLSRSRPHPAPHREPRAWLRRYQADGPPWHPLERNHTKAVVC
jgi:low temperature requirement protein LtrA